MFFQQFFFLNIQFSIHYDILDDGFRVYPFPANDHVLVPGQSRSIAKRHWQKGFALAKGLEKGWAFWMGIWNILLYVYIYIIIYIYIK